MDNNPNAFQPKSRRRCYQFGLGTLLLGIVVLSVPLGWFGWKRHLERVRIADEADAREAVFRDLLADSLSEKFTRYLAFDLQHGFPPVPVDPPAGYADRFNDLRIRIRPASQARMTHYGEETADGGSRGVEDSETGANACIFSVSIRRWVDDHTVEVDAERFSAPLNGKGYRAYVEKRDGHWQIMKKFAEWIS